MTLRNGSRVRRRVRVTIGGTATFTRNLSAGGYSAEAMRVLPRGSPVQGTMHLGEKDVGYVGSVAWVRPGDALVNLRGRMGVRFIQLHPEGQRLIEAALSAPAR
jgi:PilZ domain